MRCRALAPLGSLAVLLTLSCSPDASSPTALDEDALAPDFKRVAAAKTDRAVAAEIKTALTKVAYEVEADIQKRLPGVQLAPKASWMGDGKTAMGGFVFFNDRGNKRLPLQWVPGDPRRQGRTDIRYGVFPDAPAGLTPAEVDAAIDAAMGTWGSMACSNNLTIGEVAWSDLTADIIHFGFAPLGPGVLGATFPFIWVDSSTGIPTDIDGDGYFDYAFAVILYSSDFPWGIDTNTFPFIDVQTVALHEAGHGLAQGHYGKAFLTLANGKLHFAPRAVMNAAYSGLQQAPTGTDNGGHCGMWGSWPNN